ncbi:MAG: patatin-like phospholipase family protein [Acidimicrobiia bacterium]|nr:patatin-like phospholipase family protein [Acidimicrobiia bacterium]
MSPPLVVIASGHMIDAPGRTRPRFPVGEVPRVATAIGHIFDEWGVGAGTTLVCGGARGTDIMAAEAAIVRGASVIVCLPHQLDEFLQSSVELPGDRSWVDRFDAVADRSEVRPPHDLGRRAETDDAFTLNGARMIELANAMSSGAPHVLGVWDGRGGDGPGGTADVMRRCTSGRSARVRIVDPTPRRYEARQTALGPKRLLALDGGGVRGMLTLGVLAEIEAGLRLASGDDRLVLSDFYDYIGGTGTGAITASALALGTPVAEITDHFRRVARKIHGKRVLPRRVRSVYRDGPLTKALAKLLGDGRTIGDPDLRSLLLVVLHNTSTGSPWPLSNCTEATYNRADRYADIPADRHLDLGLLEVVRGSAASPLFFAPQGIDVGGRTIAVQDGSITPFTNPAFILFAMATVPEYGLGWSTGVDRLLLTSVGTGWSAVDQPMTERGDVPDAFDAKTLTGVVMNGAAYGQDLICRTVGVCRAAPGFGEELGAPSGVAPIGDGGLFTYVRYDARLGDETLAGNGVDDAERRRAIRAVDGVSALDDLSSIGHRIGAAIDLTTDFAGFV